jgi:hypothetical protein
MNLREGTRRLALLLGVVGAICGGFASYLELQEVLSQKARHNKFEQLTASDVVRQERKRILDAEKQGTYTDCDLFPVDTHPYKKLDCFDSVVNRDGIKAVAWNTDYEVYSIETLDGQTLCPTPAPAALLYLLVALFPVLGFLIPWGAIRAIGWVGAGFAQPSK